MNLIDGKFISSQILNEISEKVSTIKSEHNVVPHLAAILIGNDGASETYVAAKIKACENTGMISSLIRFPITVPEDELLAEIVRINNDDSIHGLIVQMPVPAHLNEERILETIHPSKDVDGFHPQNVGRLTLGLPTYVSATPAGIMELLKRTGIDTSGKHCVVVGRSNIVGTPVSILMSRNSNPGNATVTLCHSRTKNLKEFTQKADILIVALGKPEFITGDMVKPGAVVIDVGITRVPDASKKSGFRLAGDVHFESAFPVASYITPVPGGVGPMTIVSLLNNTLKSASGEVY
jgi:methylenetetrahydrofolate dehydrogenase (NADP+)/methenyltetrahydrofolate cyclohydrolase